MNRRILLSFLFLTFPFIFTFGQTISSVFPDSSDQGQTVSVTITGTGVNFQSGTGVSLVRLSGPGANINSNSVNVVSATEINAVISIPPNQVPGMYSMEVLGYTNIASGIFEISGPPPSGNYYLVKGRLYYDENNNCTYDGGDLPIPSRAISLGSRSTLTDISGNYECWLPLGSVSVHPNYFPNYELIPCVPSGQINVTGSVNGAVVDNIDFPVDTLLFSSAKVVGNDPILRPGFTRTQNLTVRNEGSVPLTGVELHFVSDSRFTRKTTSNNFPFTISNDTTTWTIGTLNPNQAKSFSVSDSLSATVQLGTTITRTAWIDYAPADGTPYNDTLKIIRVVQGSYDPNDKRVFDDHGQEVLRYVPVGDSILRYYIRFQNTGTDTAFNIFVRDTIDPQLNILSFQTLAASHNYVVTMQDRAIQWFFPNIMLEDSFSNEPASHGFIDFEIKYNPNLPAGTTFHNDASIYFDYNAPVLTNETETVICNPITGSYTSSFTGMNASFSGNSSSAVSWEWDFGDGTSSTQQNPTHTYTVSGSYNVCLVVTNACGRTDTTCNSLTVCGTTANAVFASQPQSGLAVNFTDQTAGSPVSWAWSFGDGTTSTQQNPNHSYASPGTYNVCLVITDVCNGVDTTCQTVVVTCAAISAAFNTSTNSLLATFTNNTSSGTTGFLWSFGDGTTSTQANPTHTYAAGGTYNVCLIAISSCGNDTVCQTVVVTCTAIPAAFNPSPSGLLVSFANSTPSGTTGFLWNFGDGNTSTQANPTHAYSAPGTYTVCLIAQSACGNDTVCQTLTLSCTTPLSSFGFSSGVFGWDFTDQSSNSPTSWFWDFGDGGTSILQNPTNHLFPQPGTYTVCLIASNGCGSDTSCQTILITSAQDPNHSATTLFPNPTDGLLNISGYTNGAMELTLVDVTGRTVLPTQKVTQGGAFEIQLDASQLPAGVYFLQVVGEETKEFHKVIRK